MKKVIALLSLLTILLVLGCSKKEDENSQLEISYNNLVGKYYIDSFIKPDGSIKLDVGHCSTKKNYIEIKSWRNIYAHIYRPDCIGILDNFDCLDYNLFTSEGRISGCGALYNGKITDLTNTTLRIDYEESRSIPFDNIGVVKAVIFKRL